MLRVVQDSITPYLTPCVDTLVVAFSGGVDSTVLLHTLVTLRQQTRLPALHAVYVNHGISENADLWQHHCAQLCQQWNVVFHSVQLNITKQRRTSLEADAREQRYRHLMAYCKQHKGVLLLGQHQDDQLETVLLQLKRGAGPKGLSGMAQAQVTQGTQLLRPLLNVTQQRVCEYAHEHKLRWIEDESNQDSAYDRNYLRNQVLPALTQRWPQLSATVSRSANLCAEQQSMLDEVVQERLLKLVDEENRLDLIAFMAYSNQWRNGLLRMWLTHLGLKSPSMAQLGEVTKLIESREDSDGEVVLGDYRVKRFKQHLYCLHHSQLTLSLAVSETAISLAHWGVRYNCGESLTLTNPISVEMVPLSTKARDSQRQLSKTLKAWLKEWNVPPWERALCPVILNNGKVCAVVTRNSVIWLDAWTTGTALLTRSLLGHDDEQ